VRHLPRRTAATIDKGRLQDVEAFMKDPVSWSKAHGGAAQAAE
jgi:hypothetical protein